MPQGPVKPFGAVQGRCPACRSASLFLGAGGHVTCARLDCPDPSAADELLHGERQSAVQAAAVREDQAARDTHPGREESRIAHSSRASGLREALRILDGRPARGWDGPDVTECAANDRNWWDGEKEGS
ncbi:DUF6085 family protein [Streptomyces sp. CC224B]|uniref:DUF6085 family protein n=1 Tax=Streptomyces sp. CC224B TaxID=3044571 RepID=UPI0024A904BD|nr:DUF6085 family protein [Streptomyces sp. CC224B]